MTPPIVASLVGWIFPGFLLALFGICALVNAVLFIRRYILHGAAASLIPFVGGIAGAVGFSYAPSASLRHITWLPLFVDVGCVPWLVLASWMMYQQKKQIDRNR